MEDVNWWIDRLMSDELYKNVIINNENIGYNFKLER